MGGMHLSRDSNSLLIMATMWKCCTTPWSLLLWGVFSVHTGPDTHSPLLCVVNAPWDTQEQPHPVNNVWGGHKRLNLRTLQMLQSWSRPFETCARQLKVLELFGWATRHGARWICTSALPCRAALVLWVGCLLSLSPQRHCIWGRV